MNPSLRREMREYLIMTLGAVVTSAAYGIFLIPNHIAPGGVSGVATVLNYALGWPVGLLIIAFNIPLFIAAVRVMGLRFAARAFYGALILSLFIDFIPYPSLTSDGFLACVFGGALMGAGLGLVFKANGSTGGSDLAAQLISKKIPGFSIGWILFIIDTAVVIAAAAVIGPELALFGLAALYLSTKTIEFITVGQVSRAFWLITTKSGAICGRIIADLNRSVTRMPAIGHYSGESREMLFVVVNGRSEVLKLKRLVKELDPGAFMIITDAREVLGNGFNME